MNSSGHRSLFTWIMSKEMNLKMIFSVCSEGICLVWFLKCVKHYMSIFKFEYEPGKSLKKQAKTKETLSWSSESNNISVIGPGDFPLRRTLLILKLGCCFQFGEQNMPWKYRNVRKHEQFGCAVK